jgi:peptide/nickel transport system substrate-binding protein
MKISRRAFLKTVGCGSVALPVMKAGFLLGQEKKDCLVWVADQEFKSIDPHLLMDVATAGYRINLYDGLYRFQDNPPQLQPWLAEKYEVSKDQTRYTFTLRRGAKFHNGDEVTAEDVRYSMERQIALGVGAAPFFKPIVEGTTAIDKNRVEFKLKYPYAPFLPCVTLLNVVNSRLVKAHEASRDYGSNWLTVNNDAGSGSYQLESHDPAIGFKAKRFAGHFLGWKDRYIDKIEFRTVRETSTRVMGLLKGEFDVLGGRMEPDQLEKMEKDPNITVHKDLAARIFNIRLNNQRPPLNDVHVRRAISYCFDYDGCIKDIMKNEVERNAGPIPNNMWGSSPEAKGYTYDIKKAKEELRQAKVKIDRPLEIVPLVGYPATEQVALLLQAGLKEIGVESKINPKTWPTVTSLFAKPETTPDICDYWISMYYPDPHNWTGELYESTRGGSWSGQCWYKNPVVDEILKKAVSVSDREQRTKYYKDVTKIVMDDAVELWVFNTRNFTPISKGVAGFRFCPIGSGMECRWLYWKV